MYYDGINLAEGSIITNLTIESGSSLPSLSDSTEGELFYKTGSSSGLYVFNGTQWIILALEENTTPITQVPFIIQTPNISAPNAIALSLLGAGILKVATDGSLSVVQSFDLSGNSISGTLPTSKLPAFSGDVTSVEGSGDITLKNSGVAPGTYTKVVVDAKGRVISGLTGTTLSDYGITDALGASLLGSPSGIAKLDAEGKIELSQLKSAIIEGPNTNSFPAAGTSGNLYIAIDSKKIYRWDGVTYVELNEQPSTTDDLPEGMINLYFTNTRVEEVLDSFTMDGGDF